MELDGRARAWMVGEKQKKGTYVAGVAGDHCLSTTLAANSLDTRPFCRETFECSIIALHKNLPKSRMSYIFHVIAYEMDIRGNLQQPETFYSIVWQNHISVNCPHGSSNFNLKLNFIFDIIFNIMCGCSIKLTILRRICSCYCWLYSVRACQRRSSYRDSSGVREDMIPGDWSLFDSPRPRRRPTMEIISICAWIYHTTNSSKIYLGVWKNDPKYSWAIFVLRTTCLP